MRFQRVFDAEGKKGRGEGGGISCEAGAKEQPGLYRRMWELIMAMGMELHHEHANERERA